MGRVYGFPLPILFCKTKRFGKAMGRLAELLKKEFGFETRTFYNRDTQTITVAGGRILRATPDRIAFLIVNCGANAAYVLPDPAVAANRGIVLNANGGFSFIWYKEDGDLPSFDWYGIAPGGAVNCVILEIVGI